MNLPDPPKPPEEESVVHSHKPGETRFSEEPVVFPEGDDCDECCS